MDVIDISGDENILEMVKKVEEATAKTKEKQGQLVKDHPPQSDLVQQFFVKLLGKSIITPSSSPCGDFARMALGTDYTFPNREQIDGYFKAILITQVPEPYPPCVIDEKDLKPITISEMHLEHHHRGAKVFLRLISPPDRSEAVMAIVEDQDGTAVLIKLYQQVAEKEIPCTVVMLYHRVFIVKDPFFQRSFDADCDGPIMNRSAYYTLRVDHPSDIICLHHGDERIPEKWRGEEFTDVNTSQGFRSEGNKSFCNKRYTRALEKAETPEDKQLAYLNRSLTNLRLGRPAEALLDAIRAYNLNSMPTEKVLFRHAIALYTLQEFEQCQTIIQNLLDAFPDSQVAKSTLKLVKSRLVEQRTGKYNFQKMYEQAKTAEGPPIIDSATFSSLVEVRDSPGRGRGLFTTKSVIAGELLLVEKAFSYSFIDETRLMDDEAPCMVNSTTKRITAGASANLWPQVVQKLYHDPDALSAFEDLWSGDYEKVVGSESDGSPVVDSFLVEKILSLNSFGSPRTTRDFCKNDIWSGKQNPSTRERPLFTTAGVWLLAARINHSCVGNCRRSFIGDMQIIRAARDIPAGTELTFPYRPSTPSESYQDVQKNLAKWGFVCDCELCKERRKTTESVRLQRDELQNDFLEQLPSDKPFDFGKATKLVRAVEKTYRGKPTKQIRWVLADHYANIGIRCRQDGEFVDATEMIIKALEAMGFVIYATPPADVSGQPRFEVKHWGMMEHFIPWLFFQLIECYDEINPVLVPPAEHYAQIAYSIIIGEKDSMWDVMPLTGVAGRSDMHVGEDGDD